jgi:glutamate synthase (NADPH/NADH) large chain
VGSEDFECDILWRHQQAFHSSSTYTELPESGIYHWRRDGEAHLHSPAMISGLQKATRINSRDEFKSFCDLLDKPSEQLLNLRGLLAIKKGQAPVALDEVEPASAIVRRFATGAMSLGSISIETHETIALAMNRMGGKSNSGEGGEDAARAIRLPNGDSRRSAIKQVASGRFGVTSHYLSSADELQIKMAQGAKPGEGGQLPGDKVDESIARVRHSTPGITLISPPPHHDIYSIEDLAQLIYDLKNANQEARINVKLVSEAGVGTIAAGVAKAKAEAILISGHEGGTGASPISSIKHAGLPWELGLAETHRMLVASDLRSRVTLQVDGQLRTPRDIAIATLLGAEEWGVGTGALVVLGCIMMRKCHLNTCPVGIATQDPHLRKKFDGQPEHLINYFFLLAEGLREIMADLGFRSLDEMVGRADLLERRTDLKSPRLQAIDLSALLGEVPNNSCRRHTQEFGLENVLDARFLIPASARALEGRGSVTIECEVRNTDRSLGTMLSQQISKIYGEKGMTQHSIELNLRGTGGQSFLAFGARGLRVNLEGEVNDYCGKGLSGAEIAVRPPESFFAESNVICGNVALYGATSGSLFIRGLAGERFAVRNSGAHAVVEGLGDHGCEYMTGGSVIVLGHVGRNFGAGMSGGIAYLYSRDGQSLHNVNQELLQVLPRLEEEDIEFIGDQLERHWELTGSPLAKRILDHWAQEIRHFTGIAPLAYRTMMLKDGGRLLTSGTRGNFIQVDRLAEQGGYHG